MKYCFLLLLSILSLYGYTQTSIIYLTPEQLVENIKNNTSKATVIQFWIPNCAAAEKIVTHYNELENEYSAKVDFYFIGITNKETLVGKVIEKTGFKYKIYIADPAVHEDINIRRETFSARVCQLLHLKKNDFLTIYLDKKGKVTYYGNTIDIEPKKLKRIL